MKSGESSKSTIPDGTLLLRRVSKSNDGTVDSKRKTDFLCSSCDRCRAKKIKCDGERPCGMCKAAYKRKNVEELDLTVACVYSLAKRRGPPPKRKSAADGHSGDRKKYEVAPRIKQQKRHDNEEPVVGTWSLPTEVSSVAAAVANNDNNVAATSLNLLGIMNPANSAALGSMWWQNQHQEGTTRTRSPLDPISAALQTLGIPAMTMAEGQVGGAPVSRGHTSSNSTQPLAHSQQLFQELLQPQEAQQLQLQQSQALQQLLQALLQPPSQQQHLQQVQVLQELLQPPASQLYQLLQPQVQHGIPTSTAATSMAEEKSPLSSSEEDGRSILSLQNELKQLRRRVNDLEAENARMKEIIELFQMEGK